MLSRGGEAFSSAVGKESGKPLERLSMIVEDDLIIVASPTRRAAGRNGHQAREGPRREISEPPIQYISRTAAIETKPPTYDAVLRMRQKKEEEDKAIVSKSRLDRQREFRKLAEEKVNLKKQEEEYRKR